MVRHVYALQARSIRILLGMAVGLVVAFASACDSPLDPRIELLLSELEVDFRAIRGNTAPLQTSLTAWNAGGGRLGTVSCPAEPASWLACDVADGNVVVLTADASELTESPGTVQVPVSASGASGAVSVSVTLEVESPSLALDASTLEFTAEESTGATTPAERVVAVTNAGAGTLADLGTIECDPSDPRVACVVDPVAGLLTVSIDPTGLDPGTFLYPVSVEALHSDVGAALSVVLTIQALPHIALSSHSVHFEAIRGVETPLTRTVTVTNSGLGSLGTVSCTAEPAPWLSCAVAGNVVTLTALSGALTESPTPSSVNVTATEAANSPQVIEVGLALEQPLLALSTNAADFDAFEGAEEGDPAEIIVDVLNTGAGTPEHLGEISCVVPTDGPVACVVDDEARELALSIDPENLAPGITVHPVTVTAEHSDVTQTITVVVTTSAPPHPVLTPDELNFVFGPGATTPVEQTVMVTNGGGGSLGEVACGAIAATWLTCAVEEDDGEIELVVTASPAGLSETPEPVVIEVTATGGPDDAAELTVHAVVQQEMALDAATAEFTASAGGEATVPPGTATTPGTRTVTVTNASGGSLSALGEIGCEAETPVSCAVDPDTGEVEISVDPEGLAPGDHHFVVRVSAEHGSNSPRTVVVILTVTP